MELIFSVMRKKNKVICPFCSKRITEEQGGITCGAIDEPRKSLKAIDKRVIINFRDKNVVIARFRDKNVVIARFRDKKIATNAVSRQNSVCLDGNITP